MPRYWAVMPAAGIGSRMRADRPKQYLPLLGQTVIEHSMAALCADSRMEELIVVLAADDPWWAQLQPPDAVQVAMGGAERADSVLAGLQQLAGQAADDDWVLVHDAARPCLQRRDLATLIDTLADDPVGGLLAQPVAETVKRAGPDGRVQATVDRMGLWRAQTPQMFRYGLLRDALSAALVAGQSVTDEASAVEWFGHAPLLVAGHASNLKITLPEDLRIAEQTLRNVVH